MHYARDDRDTSAERFLSSAEVEPNKRCVCVCVLYVHVSICGIEAEWLPWEMSSNHVDSKKRE